MPSSTPKNALFALGASFATATAQAERNARWVRLVRATIAVFVVLAIGTYGYWYLSDGTHSIIEALYMTVISISTVGFNEVIPIQSDAMRLFTMGLIFLGGATVVYFLAAVAAFVVEGDFLYGFWRRRLHKELSRLEGHVVVCGLGRVGYHTFGDLFASRTAVVGIDREDGRVEGLINSFGERVLFMVADAFDEAALRGVRIDQARTLIAALPDDRDNFLLCVTARQLNPSIRLIVRMIDPTYADMFADVRAEAIVYPPSISGVRMANELTRPELTAFTRRLVAGDAHLRELALVPVPAGAQIAGQTLLTLDITGRTDALVIGLRKEGQPQFVFRPTLDTRLQPGDVVLVHASRAERKAVATLLSGGLPPAPPRPAHTVILPLIRDPRLGPDIKASGVRRGHAVVIGAGAVGRAVVGELLRQGLEVIAVDRSAHHLGLIPSHPHLTVKVGDVMERALLAELDLPTARGVVTALQPLRDNLFLAAVVHHQNPRARVVARVGSVAEGRRLQAVGAAITNPGEIGGAHLAHLAIHPELAEFAEGLEGSLDRPEQLAIVPVASGPSGTGAAGKTLGELELQHRTGCLVLGARDREGLPFTYHPMADRRLREGGSLVVLGEPFQIAAVRQLLTGEVA